MQIERGSYEKIINNASYIGTVYFTELLSKEKRIEK